MAVTIDGSAGVTYPVVAGSSSALQASSGKVLQVVSTTKTDTFSTASTSFVDVTGFSVTITPTSTSSQILVFVSSNYGTGGISVFGIFNLLRGSTNISQPSTAPTYNATTISYASVSDVINNWSMLFLDSPATTSATTYKIQARASTGTVQLNRRNTADSAQTSTITVMEIAA